MSDKMALTKGERNRKSIVEAAHRLFYQRGYNQTSFSDIAKAAGIPRGNFYYYFQSKEDILDAVLEYRVGKIKQLFPEWEEHGDAKARLKAYVDTMLGERADVVRYGCPMGTLNAELSKTQPSLKRRTLQLLDLFRNWLTDQFEALGFDSEAEHMAGHLVALVQGASLVGSVYEDQDFLRREVEELKRWIDGL